MRYAIITYGSRGDVQPYIALALGLMDRGHVVTLLAPENFKDFVEGYGVAFYPLHGNMEEILYSPQVLRLLKTGDTVSLMYFMQKSGRKIQPKINQDMLTGVSHADVLIASVLCIVWIRSIAEKLNKRWGAVQLNPPTMPTKKFPFAGFAFFDSPGYNLFTYRFLWFLHWQFLKKEINYFRVSIGLRPMKISLLDKMSHENILNLYAFSSQLIARPNDWDSNCDITGFLTLPAKNRETHEMDQLPEGLKQWLVEGEKPIYIGFGSMPVPNAELFGVILNEIISKTNQRVVFCKGWSVISDLPLHPNLFTVNYVNHQWLFPQCSVAVIHGGIGTIAAVLKAKIPVIIVSVFADQPWWGKIIEDKKLGFHIPFKKLTVGKLMKAIETAQTAGIRKIVSETAEKINNEDGLKIALDAIENYFV